MKLVNYHKFFSYLEKKLDVRIEKENKSYETQTKYMLANYIQNKDNNITERVKVIYNYLEQKGYLKPSLSIYYTRIMIVEDVAVLVKPPLINLFRCYIYDVKLFNTNRYKRMLYKYIWTLYQMAFPFFKVIVFYSTTPNNVGEQEFGLIKKQRMLELIGYIKEYVKENENELDELNTSLLKAPVFVYNEKGVIIKRDL